MKQCCVCFSSERRSEGGDDVSRNNHSGGNNNITGCKTVLEPLEPGNFCFYHEIGHCGEGFPSIPLEDRKLQRREEKTASLDLIGFINKTGFHPKNTTSNEGLPRCYPNKI